MISRYDKKTNTLTLTIPELIMLPEWTDNPKPKKAKAKSTNGQVHSRKRTSSKKTARKR